MPLDDCARFYLGTAEHYMASAVDVLDQRLGPPVPAVTPPWCLGGPRPLARLRRLPARLPSNAPSCLSRRRGRLALSVSGPHRRVMDRLTRFPDLFSHLVSESDPARRLSGVWELATAALPHRSNPGLKKVRCRLAECVTFCGLRDVRGRLSGSGCRHRLGEAGGGEKWRRSDCRRVPFAHRVGSGRTRGFRAEGKEVRRSVEPAQADRRHGL